MTTQAVGIDHVRAVSFVTLKTVQELAGLGAVLLVTLAAILFCVQTRFLFHGRGNRVVAAQACPLGVTEFTEIRNNRGMGTVAILATGQSKVGIFIRRMTLLTFGNNRFTCRGVCLVAAQAAQLCIVSTTMFAYL